MHRNLAVLIAAPIVNLLAAITLNFVSSLALTWLLLSVFFASAGVTLYGAWVRVQEVVRSVIGRTNGATDRLPTQTKSASTEASALGAMSERDPQLVLLLDPASTAPRR